MSVPKPLSYCVLKTVLQQAEPNFRFHLDQNLPPLRTAEKLVPMRIKDLEIKPSEIKVNGKSYSMEIMEHRPNSQITLDTVRHWGEDRKVICEIDKYGIPMTEVTNWTPGDMQFGELQDEITEVEHLQILNTFLRSVNNIAKIEALDRDLEMSQFFIERYRMRRENIESTLQHFIHLKIGRERSEFVDYHQNLGTALKYMTEKLLERRTLNIQNLTLNGEHYPVFRLPENLKINVHNLGISNIERRLNLLQSILSPSCLPLKNVTVDQFNRKDAECLKLEGLLIHRGDFVDAAQLSMLSRVHFPKLLNPVHEVHDFIRHWKREAPEIGTHVSFAMLATSIEEVLEIIKNEPGAFEREGSIIIPLVDGLEINVDDTSANTIGTQPLIPTRRLLHLKVQRKITVNA